MEGRLATQAEMIVSDLASENARLKDALWRITELYMTERSDKAAMEAMNEIACRALHKAKEVKIV